MLLTVIVAVVGVSYAMFAVRSFKLKMEDAFDFDPRKCGVRVSKKVLLLFAFLNSMSAFWLWMVPVSAGGLIYQLIIMNFDAASAYAMLFIATTCLASWSVIDKHVMQYVKMEDLIKLADASAGNLQNNDTEI